MKKTVILFGVLGLVLFSSCKKYYMCTCVNSAGNSWDNEYLDPFSASEADAKQKECESTAGCTFKVSPY